MPSSVRVCPSGSLCLGRRGREDRGQFLFCVTDSDLPPRFTIPIAKNKPKIG